MPKKKFYAVSAGRKIGIFGTWDECKEQVHGFKDAKYKGFPTLKEAQKFVGIFEEPCHSEVDQYTAAKPPLGEKRAIDLEHSNPSDDSPQPVAKRPRVAPKAETNGDSPSSWSVLLSFDGGSRGNPGLAGSGAEVVVVERTPNGVQKARTKIHAREFLGTAWTNNMAEWQGVLSGLQQVVDHVQRFLDQNKNTKPAVKLVIQGDSQLVIRQLEGIYQCKNASLRKFKTQFEATLSRLKEVVLTLEIKYEHVYRSDNSVADRLANEAMDAKRSWVTRTEDIEGAAEADDDLPGRESKVYADV